MTEDKEGNHHFQPGTAELKITGYAPTVLVSQLVAAGVPEDYAKQLPAAIEEDRKSEKPSLTSPRVKKWLDAIESGAIKGVSGSIAVELGRIILHAIDFLR